MDEVVERQCLECGATFAVASPASRKVRCSQRCTDRAFKQRRREQVGPVEERVCEECGKAFMPKKRHSPDDPWQRGRFCSRACKERAYSKTAAGAQALRKVQFKTKYGITVEQYAKLMEAQGHRCAICRCDRESVPSRGRVSVHEHDYWLHVDHDHDTGKVRGLICNQCNLMLGHARDDASILRAAIRYLGG